MTDILSPFFGGVGTLAKAIYDIWRDTQDRKNKVEQKAEEKRDKELDRSHQEKLQKAQHRHEIEIIELKNKLSSQQILETRLPETSNSYLFRLQEDAIKLESSGFDVIYEPIENGYGLAVNINNCLFAFILLNSYPEAAPKIFEVDKKVLSEITFSNHTWNKNLYLIDIVEALADS